MPSLTESNVRDLLRDCYDPHIPCNIVDLGLVEHILVTPDLEAPGAGIPGVPGKHRVAVQIIASTSLEEVAQHMLLAQIENRLAGLETVSRARATLLDQPLWTPARITSAGRRILGLDGNPQLIQITARPQEK